mmetsp:Transcript_17457/g.55145  ORF Transcript_17457/g.55145 Transcript_17457/m.55145 type:complete len:147 (+) Transcript_17457:1334-1774(+)
MPALDLRISRGGRTSNRTRAASGSLPPALSPAALHSEGLLAPPATPASHREAEEVASAPLQHPTRPTPLPAAAPASSDGRPSLSDAGFITHPAAPSLLPRCVDWVCVHCLPSVLHGGSSCCRPPKDKQACRPAVEHAGDPSLVTES